MHMHTLIPYPEPLLCTLKVARVKVRGLLALVLLALTSMNVSVNGDLGCRGEMERANRTTETLPTVSTNTLPNPLRYPKRKGPGGEQEEWEKNNKRSFIKILNQTTNQIANEHRFKSILLPSLHAFPSHLGGHKQR